MEASATPISWSEFPAELRGVFEGFRSPKGETKPAQLGGQFSTQPLVVVATGHLLAVLVDFESSHSVMRDMLRSA